MQFVSGYDPSYTRNNLFCAGQVRSARRREPPGPSESRDSSDARGGYCNQLGESASRQVLTSVLVVALTRSRKLHQHTGVHI